MRSTEWPAERVTQLRSFLDAGMSASQIARALTADGFEASRNAVIGKVHRLNAKLKGNDKPRCRWTAEADAMLREHWETTSSYRLAEMLSEIGFPVSPGAVRNRVKIVTGIRKGMGARGRPRNSVSRPARVYEPPPAPPEARMVSLLDLEWRDCRFPLGDPKHADFGFCGAPKDGLRPYCRYHHSLAYQPDSAMRKSEQKATVKFTVERVFVSGMAL